MNAKKAKDLYNSVLQMKSLQSEVEKAKDAFAPKPFALEWKPLKQILTVARPVLAVFSIVTGFGFLYYQFSAQIHYIAAGTFAVVILVFVELLKGFFGTLTAKKYYLKNRAFTGLLVLTFAFFGLSVFFSVNGVKELHSRLDRSVTNLQERNKVLLDSVRSRYDSLAAAENSDFAGFKESVTYKGKINVYNPAVKSRIQVNTERLEALAKEKEHALAAEKERQNTALAAARGKNEFTGSFGLFVSGFVELSILFSLFGLVWYQWKVSQESETFEELESYEFTLPDLQNVVLQSLAYRQENPYLGAVPAAIGFQSGTKAGTKAGTGSLNGQENNTGTKPASGTGTDYVLLDNAPKGCSKRVKSDLVRAVKDGVTDSRTLSKEFRINIVTANEVIKRFSPQ